MHLSLSKPGSSIIRINKNKKCTANRLSGLTSPFSDNALLLSVEPTAVGVDPAAGSSVSVVPDPVAVYDR